MAYVISTSSWYDQNQSRICYIHELSITYNDIKRECRSASHCIKHDLDPEL